MQIFQFIFILYLRLVLFFFFFFSLFLFYFIFSLLFLLFSFSSYKRCACVQAKPVFGCCSLMSELCGNIASRHIQTSQHGTALSKHTQSFNAEPRLILRTPAATKPSFSLDGALITLYDLEIAKWKSNHTQLYL